MISLCPPPLLLLCFSILSRIWGQVRGLWFKVNKELAAYQRRQIRFTDWLANLVFEFINQEAVFVISDFGSFFAFHCGSIRIRAGSLSPSILWEFLTLLHSQSKVSLTHEKILTALPGFSWALLFFFTRDLFLGPPRSPLFVYWSSESEI